MPDDSEPTTPTTFNVPAHPGPSSTEVSRRMARLARRDNEREKAIRSALHSRGMRYRVTYKVPNLPRRTIDIAFTKSKVAVFVDGCFWHGCPDHGTAPRSNAAWWAAKISANQARDVDTTAHLESIGWHVIRLWEHVPLTEAVDTISTAVRG
jgi:DNA mismatch endonuclease (patch repair protein)